MIFQSKMKKRKTGRDESVNGNDGDDEGFESSPEKVLNMKYKVQVYQT